MLSVAVPMPVSSVPAKLATKPFSPPICTVPFALTNISGSDDSDTSDALKGATYA